MKTSHPSRLVLTASLVLGLGLAACGGSDDDQSAVDDAAATADGSDEAAANDDATNEAAANDDATNDDATNDDATGVGSNDELEESLDDAGVDLDLDDLEDTIAGYSTGDGGGTFTIDGATYAFAAELCLAFENDLAIEGPGVGPNGEPFWGAVNVTETTRQEMADVGLADAQLDSMFGDNELLVDVDLGVELGRTEMFGSGPDDQPFYTASILLGSIAQGEVEFAIDGGSITASGQMVDTNGAVLEWNETVPFDLAAGCS